MPRTEVDPLGDAFTWRLRAALNRVQPRWPEPRYLSPARHRIGVLRLAPAAAIAGVAAMLALTAYAATGSPNPGVWTHKFVNTIGAPNVLPETAPAASPSEAPSPHAAVPAAPQRSAEPTERPEPSEASHASPRPAESPEPGDNHNPGDN